ncbi:MAG: 16S rRNA (uracil(1498)-N(3))-methyltransferase [Deltaproteobacteria bacterium]|nr:16S rRNA (uracil(1498)-N(3))-methyltransferase [Deltaproteobacteria bacterium]
MRRFFLKEAPVRGKPAVISGKEARHIIRVLRMGRGDRLILIDPEGNRFFGIIQSLGTKSVTLAIEKPAPKPSPSPVEILLCQALLKSRAMDMVIQKASEIGVDRIIPFTSERTVVKLDQERFGIKRNHWEEIALSSAKQCDRTTPMKIGPLRVFQDLVSATGDLEGLKVILWEQERTQDLKSLLRTSSRSKKFIALVGPEGGFSSREIQLARQAGFVPVSLGDRILRAETASVAIATIAQYEWGDLGG